MINLPKKLASGLLLLSVWFASAAWAVNDLPGGPGVRELNIQTPATKIAEEQIWLHWFMMVICTVIFVAVFGVMFYSILRHRKSLGHKAANFHESLKVEIAWTVIPFVIVIFMALPATKAVVAEKDTSNADLTIKATGQQWKWSYDYLKGQGEGISMVSTLDNDQRVMSNNGAVGVDIDDYLLKVDHPLVVPVNKKIRIITTSTDVIHAFAVPSFGIKQDAVPGFVRDTWFRAERVGDFHGQCQELCGKEHAYMPIHVKVLSQEDYDHWVSEQLKLIAAQKDDPTKVWTKEELLARGAQVYAANCQVCHQPNGKGGGPVKPLDGSSVVLNADKSMQIMVLLNGRNNGAMPSWKALSDTDLAAVISFTKNNWSNKTNQIVQPAEVLASRK